MKALLKLREKEFAQYSKKLSRVSLDHTCSCFKQNISAHTNRKSENKKRQIHLFTQYLNNNFQTQNVPINVEFTREYIYAAVLRQRYLFSLQTPVVPSEISFRIIGIDSRTQFSFSFRRRDESHCLNQTLMGHFSNSFLAGNRVMDR